MEHRWGKRTPLDLAVRCYLGSGFVASGRLTNASLSGAFMQTSVRVPTLAKVFVELYPNDLQRDRASLLAAYVVRGSADGVGIEWGEFSPAPIAALLSRTAVYTGPQRRQPTRREIGAGLLRSD